MPSGKPLIMVCGKYGCGKTTTARFMQKHLEAFDKIGIDEVRQQMGLFPYRKEDNALILRRIDEMVRGSLAQGTGVIVDRPHQTYESRLMTYMAAFEYERPLLIVESVCPEETARLRISVRPKADALHMPSNDPGIFDRIKRNWEEISKDFGLLEPLQSVSSYIRFDTHLSRISRVNEPSALREFTEEICRKLEGFRKPQQDP